MTALKPLRRLGQNFLVDEGIINRIVDACGLTSGDIVLEIGPGQGALTSRIVPLVRCLHAVETDVRMVDHLRNKSLGDSLVLHHADILSFPVGSIRDKDPVILLGNLPYCISTPIIEKMIVERRHIVRMFFTLQREFVSRLRALPGSRDYSALTCLMGFYADTSELFRIPRGSFRPVPKVESCFVCIEFRKTLPFRLRNEEAFAGLVRLAFLQRRKTLLNALSSLGPKAQLKEWLERAGLNGQSRPEVIAPLEYARLASVMELN